MRSYGKRTYVTGDDGLTALVADTAARGVNVARFILHPSPPRAAVARMTGVDF